MFNGTFDEGGGENEVEVRDLGEHIKRRWEPLYPSKEPSSKLLLLALSIIAHNHLMSVFPTDCKLCGNREQACLLPDCIPTYDSVPHVVGIR